MPPARGLILALGGTIRHRIASTTPELAPLASAKRRTHPLIYVYWVLAVPTGLLASVVVLLTISGQRLSSATPDWLALVASAAVFALLG